MNGIRCHKQNDSPNRNDLSSSLKVVNDVVIIVKCDPNRSRGYGAVGVENGHSPLLWPVAYTTACTTVQAVMQYSTAVTSKEHASSESHGHEALAE